MYLSKRGISPRLYRWYYCEETLPSDGCLYFRRYIRMWALFWLFFALTLPANVLSLGKNKHEWYISRKDNIAVSIIIWCILYVIYCTGFYIYNGIVDGFINVLSRDDEAPIVIGFFVIFLSTVGLFVWLFTILMRKLNWIIDNKINNVTKEKKPKGPSKLNQYYHSLKEKYCIKLEWY